MPSFNWARISILVLAALAAGCSTVDTKTVVSNSDGYLSTEFTPAQLKEPVRIMVEKGAKIPKLFERIDYTFSVEINEEGKTSQVSSSASFISIGNGYIQQKFEVSRNGVPYRINLGLTFAGIYRLKTQTAFLDRPNAIQPVETKEMTRFDRDMAMPKAGQSYIVESKTGNQQQIASFFDENQTCLAGQQVAASTLHSALTGSGIQLECTMKGQNGVVVSKSNYIWVADLGVAFQTESVSSRSTGRYKIETLSIKK
jgi:hypothetical protein